MTNDPISVITEQFQVLASQNETLREELSDVRMMFDHEDRFWNRLGAWTSGEGLEGFDLEELQDISKKIRPHVVGDSLVRQGANLHTSYVWSRGVNIEGIEAKKGAGRPSALREFYNNPVNQSSLFSTTAQGELQRTRYSDGNIFLACNTRDKTVRVIPLGEISGLKLNPDFPSEVWAYKRTWNPDSDGKPKNRWYYTNAFKGTRQKSITQNKVSVPVDSDVTVVDRAFGRIPGFVLGVPDSIGMHVWVAAYNEVMEYGRVVNESLAKILYKVTNKTKQGVQSTGVKVSNFSGHGGTASMIEGQDLTAVSTAGRGYDFAAARGLSAMAAAAIGVSNIELLADSSAAGSSYGASQALTPSVQNHMKMMQREWQELITEVLELLNFKNVKVWFDAIVEPDLYRSAQALTLLAPTLSDEEYRSRALDLIDIAGDPATIPDTLKMRSQPEQTAAQQSSPDQGRSNSTGGGGQGANDQRSDGISSSEAIRREMANDDFLVRFEELVQRAEAIQK